MPKGAALGVSGEYIHHTTGVRMRVNGAGNLRMTLLGLDDVRSYVMVPFVLSSAPGIEPTRGANFKNQRTRLRVETTAIDEFFTISRIILFMKPTATSLPM